MIEIEHLNKTYPSPTGDIHALRDVDLRIEDGEIFGIIGLSGAGKSTLVRCINLLERPTSGTVRIDGRDMTQLSRRDLLKARQDIGMIFQSFNLLEQRTVLRNICFPLEIAGVKRDKAQARAEELRGKGKADVVTARAVANMSKLVRMTSKLIAPGGSLVALKGRRAPIEVDEASAELRRHHLRAEIHEVPSIMEDESTYVVVCTRIK